jgi:hypothetical protein
VLPTESKEDAAKAKSREDRDIFNKEREREKREMDSIRPIAEKIIWKIYDKPRGEWPPTRESFLEQFGRECAKDGAQECMTNIPVDFLFSLAKNASSARLKEIKKEGLELNAEIARKKEQEEIAQFCLSKKYCATAFLLAAGAAAAAGAATGPLLACGMAASAATGVARDKGLIGGATRKKRRTHRTRRRTRRKTRRKSRKRKSRKRKKK